jgi:hypothetical protein
VLRRDAVEPDGAFAGPDLTVHDRAVVGPVQPARGEAEGTDKEVVGRFDVLVDESCTNLTFGASLASVAYAPGVIPARVVKSRVRWDWS